MKILLIYPYFCTPSGAWSTRAYEHARRWVIAGNKVTIVTAPYEKSDITLKHHQQEIEGIKLLVSRFADNNRFGFMRRAWNAFWFTCYASYIALTAKYEVVIASSGPLSVGIPLILAKKARNKRTVFEVRDLWPDVGIALGKIKNKWIKNSLKRLERAIYRASNLIVTCSVGQKEYLEQQWGGLPIENINNASDKFLFDKSIKSPIAGSLVKKKLVHIGSMGFTNNCKFWLDVAGYLEPDEYELIFIGEGDAKNELIKQADKNNLQHVHFVGLVARNQLYKHFLEADASLMSTLDHEVQYTYSPNKLYDNLQAGIPVIQTSQGWIKEFIEQHPVGITVSTNSPKRAAFKIREFFDDEKAVALAKTQAIETSDVYFDRDKLAAMYLTHLTKL